VDANWIVSANAGRARFYAQETAMAPLKEIDDLVNTAARLRTSATESDLLGQRSNSKGRANTASPSQSSGYEPHQSPVEHQTELFARSIADYLLKRHQESRYRHLILVASPEFLGVLRKLLDPKLVSVVGSEINKDYSHATADQLLRHIRAH
jgi:protein required for attachment to host cells